MPGPLSVIERTIVSSPIFSLSWNNNVGDDVLSAYLTLLLISCPKINISPFLSEKTLQSCPQKSIVNPASSNKV